MPIKYIPYTPNTIEGQAVLDNIVRTRRLLRYRDNDKVFDRIKRGLPLYEVEKIEEVKIPPAPPFLKGGKVESPPLTKGERSGATGGFKNLLIRGECLSACAYLKDKGIKVDLVYIDPPFASGADYAKKVYIRRNPKLAEKIKKAEEQLEMEGLRAFEEKMYGDIWNKEDYLNWMYENLMAIKSVMSETASIYVHLDWHIGHYVKILMDEVFGEDNFRNEIIWYYPNKIPDKRKPLFTNCSDFILFYCKSDDQVFNIQYRSITPHKRAKEIKINGLKQSVRDENGNVVYETYDQSMLDNVWNIPSLAGSSHEKHEIGYVTQKPKALLERVINASSNEGMIVADFFGGSGVTAKVANSLKRNFIHVDVGLNSIQTTRDCLIAEGAGFDVLAIKDGVSLFRNPVQTMDKLKTLITGLKNENSLDSFWEGAIHDSKLGMTPVYIPNLLDHSTKVLDIPLMNRVLNEAMPELPDGVKQVIVYYVDIDDEKALYKFIDEYNPTEIKVELHDLKSVLDDVVINDIAEYEVKKTKGGYEIEITRFFSDRLMQKIDEYNQKKGLSENRKDLFNGEEGEVEEETGEDEEERSKKAKWTPIEISEHGLELIELISLDCTNKEGIWHSDTEIKIDKNGFVLKDGQKTKEFWDGKIRCSKKPLRMKIRNIAGDESVLQI